MVHPAITLALTPADVRRTLRLESTELDWLIQVGLTTVAINENLLGDLDADGRKAA